MSESLKMRGQIRRNLIFNAFNLFANILIGILYTPYLVKHLGIVAYGILPLTLIINQCISVLTNSMTSSLTRFYTIALQQGELDRASQSISTALGVILILFMVMLIPLGFIVLRLDSIFTIPSELVEQAQILFIFTISSFFISMISSILNITMYADNRLDHLNIIKIARAVLKFAFVVLLFICFKSDIIYVGYANLLTEIVVLLFSIYFFHRISRGRIRLNFRNFDKTVLLSMLVMTTWVIVIQIGDMGLYRIDALIINIFWSTTESGIVGAFSELGSYIMAALAVITSVFGPLILIAYSNDRHEEVVQMTIDRSLLVGVISAIVVGVMIGFSSHIVKLWLGEEFETYHTWLIIKAILIPFYTASGVFSFVCRAWNKVKIPAIIAILLGAINLTAVFLVAKLMSPNHIAIPIILSIGTIMGVLQCYILNGWHLGTIYPSLRGRLFKNFLSITLVLGVVSLLSYGIGRIFHNMGISEFVIVAFVSAGIFFLGTLYLVLNKEQRSYLWGLIHIKKLK